MTDLRIILGKNIRELRLKAGLSQEKLAEEVGVTTKHINRIENCKQFPSLEVINNIALALHVDTLELFSAAPVYILPGTKTSLENLKNRLLNSINSVVNQEIANINRDEDAPPL